MNRVTFLAVVLVGCDGEFPDVGSGHPQGLLTASWQATTDSSGHLQVPVGAPEGTAAFMVTGEGSSYVGVEQVLDPDGVVVLDFVDWVDADSSLSDALFGLEMTTAFNWPVRREDGPLFAGEWVVELGLTDNDSAYLPDEPVTITVHTKGDDDLWAGSLPVNLVWADGVDSDPEVVSAVDAAVEEWRAIWAAVDLDLDERWHQSDLDPLLGFGRSGSAELARFTKDFAGTLVVVVGESVMGEERTFGLSGGVPGTLAPSPLSFVVVSWLAHAGTDGVFADEELAAFGQTMAHEASHYLGLYHPVETGYSSWDALSDTVPCDERFGCEDDLGANLMYPEPVCDGYGLSCVDQVELTAQQAAVLQRYAGVR